jgi:hypothetical protein
MIAASAMARIAAHLEGAPYTASTAVHEEDPSERRPDWTEQDLVTLHCGLLTELSRLARPETPLEDKLDTIQWVFSEKENAPFSFASCLRVAGASPLSSLPYVGQLDAGEIRSRIRQGLRTWLRETLDRYPAWVGKALIENPEWVAEQLERNPQCINQKLRLLDVQGDLFV